MLSVFLSGIMKKSLLVFFVLNCMVFDACHAQLLRSNTIITRQGVSVTTDDVDEFLLGIPKQDRELFASNPQRLFEAIDGLLVNKSVYQDAQTNNVTDNEEVQAKIAQAERRIVIEAWLEEYVKRQPDADYRAIAEEQYILNKDQYVSPETVDVKHVLISTNDRNAQQAHQQAETILQQIKDGEITFDQAAAQSSEDPTYKDNQGLIKGVRRGVTDPAFESAAFGLPEQAPLSEVVDTQFGSHIIYLVEKHASKNLEFAEIEDNLIEEARQNHRQKLIANYLDSIKKQEVNVNQEVLSEYLDSHKLDTQSGSASRSPGN